MKINHVELHFKKYTYIKHIMDIDKNATYLLWKELLNVENFYFEFNECSIGCCRDGTFIKFKINLDNKLVIIEESFPVDGVRYWEVKTPNIVVGEPSVNLICMLADLYFEKGRGNISYNKSMKKLVAKMCECPTKSARNVCE